MDSLEKELRRLSNIDPSKRFQKESKNRLMQRISLMEEEKGFLPIFRKAKIISPSSEFLMAARVRLMNRIHSAKKPFMIWLFSLKQALASFLVLLIAVMSTLFFVEGGRTVEASQESFLQVIEGTVMVKKADRLSWDRIENEIKISSGDLIRTGSDSRAVIEFFDDTQVRLNENTSFLVTQAVPSPGYERQGVIQTALQEGELWVQTLNVDDGFASFAVSTRSAVFSTLNASFGVSALTDKPIEAYVVRESIDVQPLLTNETATLDAGQQTEVLQDKTNSLYTQNIDDAKRVSQWVSFNENADRAHLTLLREREFELLSHATGSLPGDMLYPVKQAKERLQLAFSFGENRLQAEVDLANKRLNEAIVLLKNGEEQKARESLMVYQSITKRLLEESKSDTSHSNLAAQLVIAPQKSLLASATPATLVKETLYRTEELFEDQPLKKEKIRLENSIENLKDIATLVNTGEFEAAKEALANYHIVSNEWFVNVESMTNEEGARQSAFEELLPLKQEQLALIQTIQSKMESQGMRDNQLLAMLENAGKSVESDVNAVSEYIRPASVVISATPDQKVMDFVDKVMIYTTDQGQQNQISRLLKQQPLLAENVDFLAQLSNQLEGSSKDIIDHRIAELKQAKVLEKQKEVKRKIDRAQRLREKREAELNSK